MVLFDAKLILKKHNANLVYEICNKCANIEHTGKY